MMFNDDLLFEHRLLRDLGGMTLEEMRDRMTVRELTEHVAYYRRIAAEREVNNG